MVEAETKKMHLPLTLEMHQRLKHEAVSLGIPSTALAREAIAEWLERRRRQRIASELRGFAEEHAGTELDLDPDLDEAAHARLAGRTP